MDSEDRHLLALHMIEGLGPQRIGLLLERFGSAERAIQAKVNDLLPLSGFGSQRAESVAAALAKVEVDAEVERMERAGVDLLTLGKPNYPANLATIPAAPRLLFSRGSLLPSDARGVALVGTRHPDPYGKQMARRLATDLARAGVTVVSGLARGIDGIAHQAALDEGGRTIAVLAGGLSRIYPPEHKTLADHVASAGALITEATMLAEPTRWRFPARNRIISGLSQVIVIVQAPADSGALITAEHAAEQGRTVLAVPGMVDSANNEGCHRILREGAILCRGVEDILEELDGVSVQATREKSQAAISPPVTREQAPPPGLSDMALAIWNYLGATTRAGDEIARHIGVPIPQLAGLLLTLEMKKVIRRLPGSRYERC